jgi:hypothetical protein
MEKLKTQLVERLSSIKEIGSSNINVDKSETIIDEKQIT